MASSERIPGELPTARATRDLPDLRFERVRLIRERAYELHLARRRPGGFVLSDWLQAEAEVDEHLASQSGQGDSAEEASDAGH